LKLFPRLAARAAAARSRFILTQEHL